MLSSAAYLIVIPTIFLSIMLTPPMSPTFSHLSLNGNSLAKLGIIPPALGESFGLITQLSLPSPLEVGSTITVTTSQSLRISLNIFKRRSLKSLTLIEISLSFTKPSLFPSFIATKPSVGSLPIISIGSFKSARLLHFYSPYGTTNEVFLRHLKTLLDVLPLPWNLPFRLLRASPHHSVTPILKRNAANGSHILSILNVSPLPPILKMIFLLCRSPLPLPLKLLLTSLLPNHGCRQLISLHSLFLLLPLILRRKSLLPLWLLPQPYRKQLLPPISLQLPLLRLHHLSVLRTTWRLTRPIPEPMSPCPQRLLDLPLIWKLRGPRRAAPVIGGIKIQALRPTVHPPQPRSTGNRIERPSFTRPALFQLFAEAFRPLPTLFSRFGDLTTK